MQQTELFKLAYKVAEENNLLSYINILLNYWEENPPTLGHGFVHVLNVALNCYDFAGENSYPKPADLFVAGLFHDIYRPAEGQDGEENQSEGAKVVEELFSKNKIDPELTGKIVKAINSHDSWRDSEDPPLFELLLSVADKASLNSDMTYQYVWASNKQAREKNAKPPYTSHFRALYGFVKYQQRAWEIFARHPIKGTEKAIAAYLEVYSKTSDNYLRNPKVERFEEYMKSVADKALAYEIEALKQFGRSTISIEKITALAH
jgi:HD superfamily phosphohydrolase YqeK